MGIIRTFLLAFVYFVFFGVPTLSQENAATFKLGDTEYILGKSYSTTGQPLVKRSGKVKKTFLESLGLKSLPAGFEIDHIKPLSQGGEDVPSNMQLLTIGQHKLKTAVERGEVAELKEQEIVYSRFESETQKPLGIRTKDDWSKYADIDVSKIDEELNSNKVLFTGPKGGRYYINSNGNKTYVKSATEGGPMSNTEAANERVIQTGPRGGQYYINSKGNKTYIKKNK